MLHNLKIIRLTLFHVQSRDFLNLVNNSQNSMTISTFKMDSVFQKTFRQNSRENLQVSPFNILKSRSPDVQDRNAKVKNSFRPIWKTEKLFTSTFISSTNCLIQVKSTLF